MKSLWRGSQPVPPFPEVLNLIPDFSGDISSETVNRFPCFVVQFHPTGSQPVPPFHEARNLWGYYPIKSLRTSYTGLYSQDDLTPDSSRRPSGRSSRWPTARRSRRRRCSTKRRWRRRRSGPSTPSRTARRRRSETETDRQRGRQTYVIFKSI